MLVHGIASLFIFAGAAGARKPAPPTYKVRLIAAPAPTDEERKAPEAVERPAEEKPAPVPTKKPPPKSTAAKEAPPKTADDTKREAAPRTTPKTAPLPGETPSTGSDVATVSTEGVEFPFPEYLQNIVGQVLRRWQRPLQSTPLEAEVSFLVHRDGSVSDLQFIKRSGNLPSTSKRRARSRRLGGSRRSGRYRMDGRPTCCSCGSTSRGSDHEGGETVRRLGG